MPPEFYKKSDLVKYRIKTAEEDIHSAEVLLSVKEYKAANNRAYYSIFHSISAIHAMDGVSYKRHKDAIANFNKSYVKTEIFPRELGHRIAEASLIRHASDYNDFYIATKDEASQQIQTAKDLLTLVKQYCEQKDFDDNI